VKRENEFFEAMLKSAIAESVEQEMAEFPSDEELNAMYPITYGDRKILSEISRRRKAARLCQAGRKIGKIAACFAIVLVISAAVLMSVEATRNIILDYIINIRSDNEVFEYTGGLAAMPDEFVYMGSMIDGNFKVSTYENQFGEQIFVLQNEIQHHFRDNLGMASPADSFYIDGIYVEIFSSDGDARKIARWIIGNREFQMSFGLDTEEVLVLIRQLITG
jgi:hypothetical protein